VSRRQITPFNGFGVHLYHRLSARMSGASLRAHAVLVGLGSRRSGAGAHPHAPQGTRCSRRPPRAVRRVFSAVSHVWRGFSERRVHAQVHRSQPRWRRFPNTAPWCEDRGKMLALVKLEGGGLRTRDTWPHAADPCRGADHWRGIECPCTGRASTSKPRVTRDPAVEDVATYKVRVAGDAVEVEI